MRKLFTALLVLSVAVAALAWPAAWAADRAFGSDAILILPQSDPGKVELQRLEFDGDGLAPAARDPAVAAIYGTAAKFEVDRFLFVGEVDVIVPEEAPHLRLLKDREGGWRQTKSLYFAAERAIVGALVAAALLFVVRRLLGNKGT